MGVGAEVLELSAGGFGEGTAGTAGSGSVSMAGCGVVECWRAVSVVDSMREVEPKIVSVKTEHAMMAMARDSAQRTLLQSPRGIAPQ